MPWATVAPLALVCGALGALFGAAEVTTVAFAEEQGSKALRRPAARAVGPRQPDRRARDRGGPLAPRPRPPAAVGVGGDDGRDAAAGADRRRSRVMGVALFVAGFAIAPTLIATMSLTEKTVPHARLTEGMAIMHTGIVAGVAPGATARGRGDRRVRRVPGLPGRPARAAAGRRDLRAAGRTARWLIPRRSSRAVPRSRSETDGRYVGSRPVEWRNWSGLEAAHPDAGGPPRRHRGRGRRRGPGPDRRHHREDGRHRPQLHGRSPCPGTRCCDPTG